MQPLIDASLPPEPTKPWPDIEALPEIEIEGEVESAPVAQEDQRAVQVQTSADLPPVVVALVDKAASLRELGQADAAILQLERAAQIAPKSPRVYYEMALTYAQQLQADLAKNFANKALSLAPSVALKQQISGLLSQLAGR